MPNILNEFISKYQDLKVSTLYFSVFNSKENKFNNLDFFKSGTK